MEKRVESTDTATARLLPGNYRNIAQGSGVTPQHVSRVLRGMKGSSLHIAARIAHAAGVTLDELYAFIMAQPELIVRPRRTVFDRAADAARRRRRKIETARKTKAKLRPQRSVRSEEATAA